MLLEYPPLADYLNAKGGNVGKPFLSIPQWSGKVCVPRFDLNSHDGAVIPCDNEIDLLLVQRSHIIEAVVALLPENWTTEYVRIPRK